MNEESWGIEGIGGREIKMKEIVKRRSKKMKERGIVRKGDEKV